MLHTILTFAGSLKLILIFHSRVASDIWKRAWRMAVLVFILSFLFWEFFTPFNQFSEPVLLIGLELIFWAAIAIVESFVIATVSEWKTADNEM